MMSFTTTMLHPHFGAQVTGYDLRRPLGSEEAETALDLLAEFGVLLFPGQELTPADEVAVASAINEVRRPHGNEYVVDGHPDAAVLGNVVGDGKPVGFQNKFSIEWHCSSSGWQRDTLAT